MIMIIQKKKMKITHNNMNFPSFHELNEDKVSSLSFGEF